jgi:hypothetical protein
MSSAARETLGSPSRVPATELTAGGFLYDVAARLQRMIEVGVRAVASTSGLVWVRGNDLVGLDSRWRNLVGIAA